MTISNWEIYGIPDSIRAAKYPMSINTAKEDEVLTPGIMRLAKSEIGSGHDNWLCGVIVQVDIKASNKFWVECERYHFLDIISSQSTMHKITKFEFDKTAYDEHTDPRTIAIMRNLKWEYEKDPTEENYLRLLYSNPAGMLLTARITTKPARLRYAVCRSAKSSGFVLEALYCGSLGLYDTFVQRLPSCSYFHKANNPLFFR